MINYANKNIQAIKPYIPPLEGRRKFEGRLLDFNERTIPVSKKVVDAIKNYLSSDQLQLYPEYSNLCEKIAKYADVQPSQVMITNGSDQGIDLIFRTFTEKGNNVVIPDPSFSMFYQCAGIIGNNVIKSIKEGVKLVVICNPNNPTGEAVELAEVEEVLNKALQFDTVVYVDEAYFEFCGITATGLIDKYPNLIITRTFSKAFGLASLRIGYTISTVTNISEMLKVRGPYDINMPAVVAAEAALDDLDALDSYVDEVMNRAKPMVEDFFRKNGIEFLPSQANFLLFRIKDAAILAEKLKNLGFLTRPKEDCLRLTIGTVEQMKKFINQFQNAQ